MFYKLKRLIVEARRPQAWRRAARDYKRRHPFCAVCQTRKDLEIHDVLPYHLVEDPEGKSYEWWLTNFITLCHHDHHRLAHCGDPTWLSYNPRIRELAYAVTSFKKFCRR